MLFLSGRDSGLVLSRRVHYQLVLRFAMSVSSPRNQRERSRSRNRMLGFEIRAYSGLIPRSDGRVMIENYWEAWRVA